MQICEPKKIETLGLLGSMAQAQNRVKMQEKLVNINNIIEECPTAVKGFKLCVPC